MVRLAFRPTPNGTYAEDLIATLARLRRGPNILGSRDLSTISSGLRSIAMPRNGRHIVVYHVADEADRVIEVLRILHDSMDLPRHLPPPGNTE